jgi:hypothetical protein
MRFVFAAAPLMLAGCSFSSGSEAEAPGIPAQGTGNARSYAAADFDSIDLRGSDDVDVRVGSGFSVRAEGDPEVLERLRITREGTSLRIDRRNGGGFGWGGRSAKVFVTMPRIAGAKVAGSGDLAIDRAEGARFDGAVAGSGGLTITGLQVDEARLSIAGSGDIEAKGEAERLDVSIAGSGNLDAPDLRTGAAKVSVAGSGNVRAALDGEGDVRIAGSGDVDLGEDARCTIRANGSGKARCGG